MTDVTRRSTALQPGAGTVAGDSELMGEAPVSHQSESDVLRQAGSAGEYSIETRWPDGRNRAD